MKVFETALAGCATVSALFFLSEADAFAFVPNTLITRTFQHPRIRNIKQATSLFMSAASIPDASSLSPRQWVSKGMQSFREGKIQESIDCFDASVPPGARPYLWQRGISYYYANEFEKGSQQFRDDVVRSPLDVEEIVWDIACLLRQSSGDEFPPPSMMSLPPGKQDRRPIMSTVYKLFRGEANEEDLALAGHKGGPGEEFYSLFYLALYNEARGHPSKAEQYMKQAVKTQYAKSVGSQDYMVDCAKVSADFF